MIAKFKIVDEKGVTVKTFAKRYHATDYLSHLCAATLKKPDCFKIVEI